MRIKVIKLASLRKKIKWHKISLLDTAKICAKSHEKKSRSKWIAWVRQELEQQRMFCALLISLQRKTGHFLVIQISWIARAKRGWYLFWSGRMHLSEIFLFFWKFCFCLDGLLYVLHLSEWIVLHMGEFWVRFEITVETVHSNHFFTIENGKNKPIVQIKEIKFLVIS